MSHLAATAPSTPLHSATAVPHDHTPQGGLAALTLAAIGVVYGDIGTSPLYTMKEVFAPHTGVALNSAGLIGAVSAIFWALMLVVTLKYVLLILRAHNHGEGGGLALTALAAQAVGNRPALRRGLLLLGVFGATLFYGDSIITPAVSVLGAVEGLQLLAPSLQSWVVPISVVVLVALFAVQRFGTAVVGRAFGPIIVLWFLTLAVTGVSHIVEEPAILAALNPLEAARFLYAQGSHVLLALGAIVLALTGAEALYADMGHFGRRPIQLAWMGLVMPALALNYLGQGALLMRSPEAIDNPFFRMFPEAALLPAVVLAALAAIIASQAVISGAYSMTRQAIQLGFLPRMRVLHTSAMASGQIYVPMVNLLLLVGVVAAVVGFGSSSALASAYGIAVTVTMLITTVLTFFVVRHAWKMSPVVAWGATLFFVAIDLALVAGCAVKFFDGGWFPLAMGGALFLLMSTWAKGRQLVLASIREDGLDLPEFLEQISTTQMNRADRTAVYAVADPHTVPQALLHNLKHNQVLHDRNIILTVRFANTPTVPPERRAEVQSLAPGFWRITLHFGFMETPDVPEALAGCEAQGLRVPLFETSYFLSRESVVATPGSGMAAWRERLFSVMSHNAGSVVAYFRLPDNAVVELGTRVQI
ncbi:MAG: potassium transporter Kup [Burkholderiales bacterium PBB6]|nr:MAG: potassium transporter Kup [Burkholderiales bacterium PBB6]